MTRSREEVGPLAILAFWRRTSAGEVEFFVPADIDYLTAMSLVGNNLATAARRVASTRFSINPRNNARTFEVAGQRVVTFTLMTVEEANLTEHGNWRLPRQMESEVLGAMLQDVATRL